MFALPSKKQTTGEKKKKKKKKKGGKKNQYKNIKRESLNNHQQINGASKKRSNDGTKSGGTAASSLRKKQRRNKTATLSDQFSSKLKGAQFRWLNEQLYTTKGSTSFEMFQKEPELFDTYHDGFREQAAGWRVNPLDIIINKLKSIPKKVVVADFGCGEARLAKTLQDVHTVHSFDLVAGNEFITACDIAHVPLEGNSVDVAVFCLALMGPNYVDFLLEAWRVLKNKGTLRIAEVESRFIRDAVASSLDRGLASFTSTLAKLGFKRTQCDRSNDFFVLFEFEKIDNSSGSSSSSTGEVTSSAVKRKKRKLRNEDLFQLKACRYKKR
jgi:hypothetical protein